MTTALGILLAVIGAIVGFALVVFLIAGLFRLVWAAAVHVTRFIGGEISDICRVVGGTVVAVLLAPMVLLSVVVGRWSACAHYARAFYGEMSAIGVGLYRIVIGHPARLIGLGQALEGVEKRLPQVVAEAPGPDKPRRRTGMFEGYTIIGSLQSGGSGGKLYIAEPDDMKAAALARRGLADVDQVVIKTFSLTDGSSLPQIVRESRALDAAKKLGLVLEHELTNERFWYVMPYVPGESLALVTQRLHAMSPPGGLDDERMRTALGYIGDLLRTLDSYHRGGLWHKDVKPDNIIVDGRRAHLVDFGLITPLRSAMTLTTHGTEYFRDPELVRQALRGVKVHQIDGARFDVYAAGAVLYSVIENSFPAHGGLSQITKRCPEALRWIVRRSMAEYDHRYATTSAMLADLEAVLTAPDPFALRPVDLPSMSGAGAVLAGETPEPDPVAPPAPPAPEPVFAAAAPSPAPEPAGATPSRPKLKVADWWTGRYVVDEGVGAAAVASVARRGTPGLPARRAVRPRDGRASAHEQVRSARQRAEATRRRAQQRVAGRRRNAKRADRYENGPTAAVFGAIAVAMLLIASLVGLFLLNSGHRGREAVIESAIARAGVGRAPEAPTAVAAAIPRPPAPPAAALPTLCEDAGTMLVLCDLGHPRPASLDEQIRESLRVISDAGVRLVGDMVTPSDPLDPAEMARQVELLAQAYRLRGQVPLDAGNLNERLRPLVDSDEVDWVLLLGRAAGERELLRYVLVGPDVDGLGGINTKIIDTALPVEVLSAIARDN